MSSFFLDLKSSILGLSNEVSFVFELFLEGGKSLYWYFGGPKHMADPVGVG